MRDKGLDPTLTRDGNRFRPPGEAATQRHVPQGQSREARQGARAAVEAGDITPTQPAHKIYNSIMQFFGILLSRWVAKPSRGTDAHIRIVE